MRSLWLGFWTDGGGSLGEKSSDEIKMVKKSELIRMIESEEEVSYKLHKGILVLLPENNWIEENCSKDYWRVHILTLDDEYIVIPYMRKDEPIPFAMFLDYYTIDGDNQIEHIIR